MIAASTLAAAALIRTVVRRKSANRTGRRSADGSATGGRAAPHAVGSVDDEVGLAGDRGRALFGAHPDADRSGQRPLGTQLAQRPEGVEVGGVVADVERRVDLGAGVGEEAA